MNKDPQIKHYFLPSGCLSQAVMIVFLRGDVQGQAKLRIEKHLAACELCNLAVKGLVTESGDEQHNAVNKKLRHQMDAMLHAPIESEANESEGPKGKPARNMFRSMLQLKNIVSLFPALLLAGSVFWLTAALQMLDQRLSGLHEFNQPKAGVPELPAEIVARRDKPPPEPLVAKFEVAEELPDLASGGNDAMPMNILENECFATLGYQQELGDEEEIFVVVEYPPVFPGGHEAMLKYLSENMHYPSAARYYGIQGTVYLTFVINPDGAVSNASVISGVHYLLDEKALKIIRSMPAWIPGKQNGSAVKVQFTMPVRF